MQQSLLLVSTVALAGVSSISALGLALQDDVQGDAHTSATTLQDREGATTADLTSSAQAASLNAAWRAARNALRTTLDSLELRAGKMYGRPTVPQVVIDQVGAILSAMQSSTAHLDEVELARARQISMATLIAAPEGISFPRASVRTSGIRRQRRLTVEVPQSLIAAIHRGDYEGPITVKISEQLAPAIALALRNINVDPIDIEQIARAASASAVGYGARPIFPELHVVEQNALLKTVQDSDVLQMIRMRTEERPLGMIDSNIMGRPAEQAFFARRQGAASRVGSTEIWEIGFIRQDNGAITIPDSMMLRYVLGGGSDFAQGPNNTRYFGPKRP